MPGPLGAPDQSPLSNPFFPCRSSIHGCLEFSFVLNLKTQPSRSPRDYVEFLVAGERRWENHTPSMTPIQILNSSLKQSNQWRSAMQDMQTRGKGWPSTVYQSVKCNAHQYTSLHNRSIIRFSIPNFRTFAVFHPKKYSASSSQVTGSNNPNLQGRK